MPENQRLSDLPEGDLFFTAAGLTMLAHSEVTRLDWK
jgi:hypothetical protein